jgi:uncharacterized protein with HEPN domain
MSKREWTVLFEDMLACIQKIERYTAPYDFEAFSEAPSKTESSAHERA